MEEYIEFKMKGKMPLKQLHGFIGAALKHDGEKFVEFDIKEKLKKSN